jgi:hypothetical protein
MPPDQPNDEERREELPEDQEPPFRPASDVPNLENPDVDTRIEQSEDDDTAATSTHPQTDSNLDAQEYYDSGLELAAGLREPNAGNAVQDYHSGRRAPEEPVTDSGQSDETIQRPNP